MTFQQRLRFSLLYGLLVGIQSTGMILLSLGLKGFLAMIMRVEKWVKLGSGDTIINFFLGSGRRGCPGASLALKVAHTTLAAMIQCFELKAEEKGGYCGCVDMEEGPSFILSSVEPLICVRKSRLMSFPLYHAKYYFLVSLKLRPSMKPRSKVRLLVDVVNKVRLFWSLRLKSNFF